MRSHSILGYMCYSVTIIVCSGRIILFSSKSFRAIPTLHCTKMQTIRVLPTVSPVKRPKSISGGGIE
ncbi:hypothetical protein M441DRAFT_438221 [Trichoderma asperellum CBS 433.97]|uniref:Uncharacterized protein n=1 Tax=Trichoderma asperellum (strain ATCC 204424 / CBS 433.97 / NBRC 101777) TaxID=1042311 RepID=A0A2T3Z3X0_TRIA4|nr:hypothetical protein M441DRAFT_438221 [Trichoderma asperellum CBS 433.97]PTB39450.1 hypothetical protein M441DRAFT_438221 [Trichoderma asperellum CBS 433.97]